MHNLPIDLLANRCAQETHKFLNRQSNTPDYCFELMRRALGDDQPDALGHIYQIYMPIVIRWVTRHPSYQLTTETPDYFASVAMSNFYFALRGNRLQQFSSLARVLRYLKVCVNSAILQYLQHVPPTTQLPDDDNDAPLSTTTDFKLLRKELWKLVMDIFDDEEDRLLIELYFVMGLKPRQITAAFPEHWEDPRDVSIARQRILRRLRGNSRLNNYLGFSPSSPDE